MFLLGTLLVLGACIEDVGKDKAHAIVEEAPAEAPAKATASRTLAVDPEKSKIGALGAKVTKSFPLVFHRFTGELGVDQGEVSSVSIDVDVASLTSPHDKLTAHLLKEDFLWAESFPKATFASTAIRPSTGDDGAGSHTVTGTLTIRGKSKQVTFPATLNVTATEVQAQAEFAIDRQDFEVLYMGRADDLVQDKVVLTIDLVALKP